MSIQVRYAPQGGGEAMFTGGLAIAYYPPEDLVPRAAWEDVAKALYVAAQKVALDIGGLHEVQYAGWNLPDIIIPNLVYLFDLGECVIAGDENLYGKWERGTLGWEIEAGEITVQNICFAEREV